ncbi:DUF58 domain-containing protein [Chitinibacter fontanus]|uniref:DUF58 domain-containing protein n=1 Tax=Chitinibacter fontanus TaxID=1737446 RepID=A0A7D5V7G9_9NEIS|nr:DUF58 domain-containing protein [Chitinibacter fontanus]QLI80115.1 DUF58 domain-containing protein [Chitinibacter fontanus]
MMVSVKQSIVAYWQRYWLQFLRSRHPTETGRIRIRHQRLYILPTLYGLGFALIALTMLIGALNYQLSLGFFFSFLLIGIGHAILLRSYANLLGLQLSAGNAVGVFAGENVYFPITLHNEKVQARYGVQLHTMSQEPVDCHIEGLTHQLVALPINTLRRGKLKIPRLTISSRMPMGLFRCWTYVNLDSEVLIYPQPELNPPPLPEQGNISQGRKKLLSGNDDFAGLREFQRGDARHDIAWKQSARSEKILVRQQQSTQGATLWLSWDDIEGLALEAKLSRLTAWVLQAQALNRPYGLALPTLAISPGHGQDHLQRCLCALAEYADS